MLRYKRKNLGLSAHCFMSKKTSGLLRSCIQTDPKMATYIGASWSSENTGMCQKKEKEKGTTRLRATPDKYCPTKGTQCPNLLP